MNLLFVCGRNKKRSPTAETLYRSDPRASVRSGGTSENSVHRVNQSDLEWADVVCVMERKYEARLRARFTNLTEWPEIRCLEIPDDYERMAPELIDLLQNEIELIFLQAG